MATPASSLKERRRLQRQNLHRTQVLEAAEIVFAQKGTHAATMREIAKLAEFSIGALYSMFESRDEILLKVLEWRGTQLTEGTRAVLAETRSAREQLHALAEYQIEFFRRNRHFGRLWVRSPIFSLAALGAMVDPEESATAIEVLQLQRAVFERGQASGDLRDGDPTVMAVLFTALVQAFQSTDARVLEDSPEAVERLSLAHFHEILEGAFARRGSAGA